LEYVGRFGPIMEAPVAASAPSAASASASAEEPRKAPDTK
jgi:hypothetical protein